MEMCARMCEILNNHFINVGKSENGLCPIFSTAVPPGVFLCDIKFDVLNILKKISELKINSSPGPDNIPSVLYKTLNQQLSLPLSIMFDIIFRFGSMPSEWKYAIVKHLFKKGCSSNPGNYRPISLTCIICKFF